MKIRKKLVILLSAVCMVFAASALCACDSVESTVIPPPATETDKPSTDNPSTDKPDTDKPDTDKPSTDKPDTDKPDTDKPSTDKPDTDKTDTDKPALKKFTGITFSDKTVTYNGAEQSVTIAGTLPQGAKVTYGTNKGTNAGTYNATAKVEADNYETLNLTAKLVINKATFTGITFSDKTVTYNGAEQSVTITGTLPQGATVTYGTNKGTNAGTYNATAKVEADNYETLNLTAKLVINKATFTGITFSDKTFVKTGAEREITVSGTLPAGTSVKYTDNKATEEGEYNAKAEITNPNYETLTLTAKLTINKITAVAKDILNSLLQKPEPWSFLPEAFRPENMACAQSPVTDFTSFVPVADIGDKIVGKQMAVLFEGLNDATTAFSRVDTVYAAVSTIANVYQTFINDNPEDYAQFTGEAAGFKLRITLDGDNSEILVGNSAFSAELSYDKASGERCGRIQLTDGVALKFEAGENTLQLAVKATINGVGNLKQIVFARSGDAVAGHFYEYTGTETKGLKTSAAVVSDGQYTKVMSNKRESDDMLINGYEEVYSSVTGKYIGGEVQETIKIVKYDTLWFMLGDVSGFENVKIVNERNDLNPDTVYVNNATTPFKTKKVNALIPTSSRRFDIEMKDVFYVVANETDGKTEYETVKTLVPMLFVQVEQTEDFGKDVKDNNSAQFASAPVLPDFACVTQNYAQLQELFNNLKELVTYAEIVNYIGEKNVFFAAVDN